jgi:hypothetical protein
MSWVVSSAAVAACSLPPVDQHGATCGPDSIVRTSSGEIFESFAEAVETAHADDEICIGPGTYAFEPAALQHTTKGPYSQSLSVRGAGSDETFLVAAEGYETLLYVDIAGALRVEGLTISGGRARLEAETLTIEDVAFEEYAGWKRGLALEGDLVEVDGLEIRGNQMDYASGLYVSVREHATLSNLLLHDNRSAAGYLAELHGPVELRDSRIAANVRSDEQPGYDLMEFFGPGTVDDVVFEDNDFNGPVLRAYESLDAHALVLSRNRTGFSAALTLMGPSTLSDARIEGNSAPDGAVGIYESGSVTLEAVNADVDEGTNAPCDLSGKPCADQSCHAECFDAKLGAGEPAWCDAYACY